MRIVSPTNFGASLIAAAFDGDASHGHRARQIRRRGREEDDQQLFSIGDAGPRSPRTEQGGRA
jgi:hypothetical protein